MKEMLAVSGKPIRKTASVPNISNVNIRTQEQAKVDHVQFTFVILLSVSSVCKNASSPSCCSYLAFKREISSLKSRVKPKKKTFCTRIVLLYIHKCLP